MDEYRYRFRTQGKDGDYIEVFCANVDQQFIGLSITARRGLELQRVTVEIHEREQIATLSEVLNTFLNACV